MAAWAYQCRPCDSEEIWLVSRELIDAMPDSVCVLRVRSGTGWHCAAVDRRRPVQAEGMLLRDAVASDLNDCPDCESLLRPRPGAGAAADPASGGAAAGASHRSPPALRSGLPSAQLQAAAISIAGRRMMVVLVGPELLQSPGEAGMLAADLRARLGAEVVLMSQAEDGSPNYHGEPALVELLAGVPIERMPWKAYTV